MAEAEMGIQKLTDEEAEQLPGLIRMVQRDRKLARQHRVLFDLLIRHAVWLEREGRELAQEARGSTERAEFNEGAARIAREAIALCGAMHAALDLKTDYGPRIAELHNRLEALGT